MPYKFTRRGESIFRRAAFIFALSCIDCYVSLNAAKAGGAPAENFRRRAAFWLYCPAAIPRAYARKGKSHCFIAFLMYSARAGITDFMSILVVFIIRS